MTNRWLVLALLLGCAEAPEPASVFTDACSADAPRFMGRCVIAENLVRFKVSGEETRRLIVIRSVYSDPKTTVKQVVPGGVYDLALDGSEPFAKYSVFFDGYPSLGLEFFHGTRVKPIRTQKDRLTAFWWINAAGSRVSRIFADGNVEVFDLKSFATVKSYQGPLPDRLLPYGKHRLLAVSEDRLAVDEWFPDEGKGQSWIKRSKPIFSFWKDGSREVVQTDDGEVSGSTASRTLPLGYVALTPDGRLILWRKTQDACTLNLETYGAQGGDALTSVSRSGLCNPMYAIWFAPADFTGLYRRSDRAHNLFFGPLDLETAITFPGKPLYWDERVGVLQTRRFEHAYQRGPSSSHQGILECAMGAVDFNPEKRVAVFYSDDALLVNDDPKHFKELDVFENVDTCWGF